MKPAAKTIQVKQGANETIKFISNKLFGVLYVPNNLLRSYSVKYI